MLKIIRLHCVLPKYHSSRAYTGRIEMDLKKAIENMPRIKPSGQPLKIWEQVEKIYKGVKPESLTRKFTIQEIPEDRYEEAVQHMCTYFLADEPTCESLNSISEPAFVNDMKTLWTILLHQGISIAAFTDNPDGGKPILAGMNALGVAYKNKKDSISDYKFTSKNCRRTMELIGDATKIVYERYGVDKYLYAIGLSVDPVYRGYGIGGDLLKMRNYICREYGIPATATVFTSIISQKSAERAGLELLEKRRFADIVDENGKEYFPRIKSDAYLVMGKKF